jgi:very-short-patch-repair endonuclease
MKRGKADYLHVVEDVCDVAKVKDFMADAVEANALRFSEELAMIIDKAESPIEQLLLIALRANADMQPFTQIHFCCTEELPERPEFDQAAFVYPQAKIGTYRVDLAIWDASLPFELRNPRMMIVECDGHDFHEKTKEQARKDKQRDRFLQSKGYKVLRFTGSEIWADPDACAEEVYSQLAIDDDWRNRER